MRRAAIVALALLASACSQGVRSGANLCALVPKADAEAALGAPAQDATEKASDHLQCAWTAAGDGGTRTMTAALWRETRLMHDDATMSGALFFENQLHLLEKDFPRTRVIGGLGEAAVYGFGDIDDAHFTGGIIVRKHGDVLSMRIDGKDPAAFEAAARLIAAKM